MFSNSFHVVTAGVASVAPLPPQAALAVAGRLIAFARFNLSPHVTEFYHAPL